MSEQKPTRINPESLASKQNLADKLREVYSELGQHYGYIGVLELAADEIDRLTADNKALREDAERYRWLKDNHLQTGIDSWIRTGNDLEEAIDAAIKESKR